MGFTAPAAGKTGTSRDGWFAGYTSNLLCVVWVGFDDNRDLGLAGGQAAAPIWGEFMKRAVTVPGYRNTQPFEAPPGVIEETIDPQTGQLATPSCPQNAPEYFIAGSEPTQYCQLHGGQTAQSGQGSWISHLFSKESNGQPPPPANSTAAAPDAAINAQHTKAAPHAKSQPTPADQQASQPEKKKGILDRIFGIFGGSSKPADNSKPQQ
jgi:penicillin-binding protein 1B